MNKKVKNAFQEELRGDGEKLRGKKKMFIGADKTLNFYKMDKDTHETLQKKIWQKTTKNKHWLREAIIREKKDFCEITS